MLVLIIGVVKCHEVNSNYNNTSETMIMVLIMAKRKKRFAVVVIALW